MPTASSLSSFAQIKTLEPSQARGLISGGKYRGHTAGLAAGVLQANLVILPQSDALDFMRFCQRNPKPCPLVGVTDTGDPIFRTLGDASGPGIDVRRDLPAYNVYRDGALTDELTDIDALWRDDLVAFALGCSFTFENALQQAGIAVWHADNDRTVPMFRTDIPLTPAGAFVGSMVVSMRTIPDARVAEAIAISSRFPLAHGAPVHVGDPAEIGITDINAPDWGDAAPVPPGHKTVFWACGVTPQSVVIGARLPFVITHKPGHMLITDVPENAEVPLAA